MSAVLKLVKGTGASGGLPPIERYELWMRGRGLSARTINETMTTLRRVQREGGYPIEAAPSLAISRFLATDHFGARTRYTYHGHLRGFFRWIATTEGGRDAMATLPAPRMPRSVPRPISDQQLQTLLDTTTMYRSTRVMILLAAFAGLRVHEIAKLRGQDVDIEAGTLYVTGKGGHSATIPLHPLILEAASSMPPKGWWFPAHSQRPGQHMVRNAVSNIIGDAMRRAGIPGGAHRLRHWYGTSLVASGADLRTAQTLLRHSNLASTAIYVDVNDTSRSEAIARLKPPRPIDSAPPTRKVTRRQIRDARKVEMCKKSVVRILSGLQGDQPMSRTKLSQSIASNVRPQLNAALDELSDALIVTVNGLGRAYRLKS